MEVILCIETATKSCSVSLSQNGKTLQTIELVSDQYSHSEKLTLFIEQILKDQQKSFSDLDAVAVSKGPGSYTGLRIGVSTAKGICYAIDKPSNFYFYTWRQWPMVCRCSIPMLIYCPMLDARRMEVYCAFYGNKESEIEAKVLDENSFKEDLDKHSIIFFGDGSDKFKQIVEHPNAIFIDDVFPSAKNMSSLAQLAFDQKRI